jgi:hypothetical protein
MMSIKKGLSIAATLSLFAVYASPARADKIDGDWCHVDGRHFTINYRDLTTPEGHHVVGDYGRHFFSYVVPDGEKDSGHTIQMALVNEQTVHLRVSGSDAATPPQVFKRCEQVSELSAIFLAINLAFRADGNRAVDAAT